MIKQILSKIPRKSPKPDQFDSSRINSADTCSNPSGAVNTLSSKLNVVKRVSSAVFPSSIMAGVEAVEPHLSFKDVSNLQKQSLFISKLNFCSESSDCNQDVKRQMMIEVVDFISSGSAKLPDSAISAICKTCASNLFRVFPPKYKSLTASGEGEDDEPMFDPSWSNIQIVYDLLLHFITSAEPKAAKKHLDHTFVLNLIDLFDSEDPREREFLKTILHRIYGKFMVHRPFIRKSVSNVIYRFVFETEKHNGIAELLEIFGSIITGFALPLKEEHKLFLFRALIPLHKPRSIGVYHQQLTYCVVQFVDKDPKLASSVIRGLLKYWPVTNSQKELMFISELEEILEMTDMEEFHSIMVPLFRRISSCLNSFHYQVAERAHLLWNNDYFMNLVGSNKGVILPVVLAALERNGKKHWNQAVVNLSQNVKRILTEMDGDLVRRCENQADQETASICDVEEKRRLNWERVECVVGDFQTVTCR